MSHTEAPPIRAWGIARRRGRARETALGSAAQIPVGLALAMLVPFLAAIAVLVIYPLVELVRVSMQEGGLHGWRSFFDTPGNVRALRTTFLVAAVVTAISMTLGTALAWLFHTTPRRWLRTLALSLTIVPLWIGTVTQVYAIALLLGQNGPVNNALTGVGVVDHPLGLLNTTGAAVVGMVFQMVPYATLSIYAAFSSIDTRFVAVAENLGASTFRAFRTVVLPLALRGLLGSAALVFVISLGFFITPVVLGSATSPFTASLISNSVFVAYDVTPAAINALVLVAGAMLVLLIAGAILGRGMRREAAR